MHIATHKKNVCVVGLGEGGGGHPDETGAQEGAG
jgi:hypothetical protein